MEYVAIGSERVKNYAQVGDSTPWSGTFTQAALFMVLSALGCCTFGPEIATLFNILFISIFTNMVFQLRKLSRLRREARKEGNYYVPGDPKLAFVMRIRGINQVQKP